jgi:UDP-N-acetylglucosamine acyltransferase
MINIDICVPFYNYNDIDRINLFKIFCKYYRRLSMYLANNNICNMTFTFIGSEGTKSLEIIRNIFNENEASYYEFDQATHVNCTDQTDKSFLHMLTEKFKYAYKMSLSKNPDVSLLNGSNDIVSYNYFKQIVDFYNPNEKQLYGISNYNNGNNFVFYSKHSFFESERINLKDTDKYFLWNGVSNYHGREKYKFCAGNIGFNKYFHDFNGDFLLGKCISCDEGIIEKALISLGANVFVSKNVLYLNIKTENDKELNTYSNLYSLINKSNCTIEYKHLSDTNKKLLNEMLYIMNDTRRLDNLIDDSACIDESVSISKKNIIKKCQILKNSIIGSNNHIGNNVFIDENVIIGDNNFIGDNTFIYKNTVIGNNNKIFNNNIIGEFPVHTSEEFADYNLSKCKGVIIGDNNLFHVRNIISTGIENPTKIGDNNKIMSECMISHDVMLYNNVTLYPRVSIGGYCILLNCSNLGMCSVIHQKKVIGQYSMVGANNTITKHVFPYYITINNRVHRINEKKIPTYINLDDDAILKQISEEIKSGIYENNFDNLNEEIKKDMDIFIINIKGLNIK